MAEYLKGSIEPTAIRGCQLITTKTGKKGLWIPIDDSPLQPMLNKTNGEHYVNPAQVPRYTIPFVAFRETDAEKARKWGDFQMRESWSKQRQDEEAVKPKESRLYPPTLGNCYHNKGAMQAAVTADAGADPYAAATAGYSRFASPAAAQDDMPF